MITISYYYQSTWVKAHSSRSPCKTAAETDLQPLCWCFESYSFFVVTTIIIIIIIIITTTRVTMMSYSITNRIISIMSIIITLRRSAFFTDAGECEEPKCESGHRAQARLN